MLGGGADGLTAGIDACGAALLSRSLETLIMKATPRPSFTVPPVPAALSAAVPTPGGVMVLRVGVLLRLPRHRTEQPLPGAWLLWHRNSPARLQRHHRPLDFIHTHTLCLKGKMYLFFFFRIKFPESGLQPSHWAVQVRNAVCLHQAKQST